MAGIVRKDTYCPLESGETGLKCNSACEWFINDTRASHVGCIIHKIASSIASLEILIDERMES